jgi:uncharacterized protein HemX
VKLSKKIKRMLKKDINSGLLLLVIFLLVLLAGFNIYYQKIIHDISKENSEKEAQLTEITGRLSLEEKKSEQISKLKEISEKDKEFLEKDYQELTSENEALKTEKDSMEKESDGGIGSCEASGSAECPG